MIHKHLGSTAIALVLAVAGTPALAQQPSDQPVDQTATNATQGGDQANPPIVTLSDWNYDDIYANGWSLETLIDEARVFGVEGEEIGEIENVLLDDSGKILAIIAEVGGFWDIGDTHVAVPWEQAAFSPALDVIEVPVDQENVEDFSIFGEWGYFTQPDAEMTQVVNDDLLTGPRVWKATELLDDYALLTGSMAYGYVDDLIFTNDGMLHAVVVDSDMAYAGGPRAFPYYGYGYGWSPVSPYYTLPYGADDVAVIETFDYDRLSDDIAMTGTETMEEPTATGSIDSDEAIGEDAGDDAN